MLFIKERKKREKMNQDEKKNGSKYWIQELKKNDKMNSILKEELANFLVKVLKNLINMKMCLLRNGGQ